MAASTAATATTQPRGKAAFMEAEELASLRLARELAAAELHGARRLRSRDASSAGASPRPAAAPTPHNVAPTTNVTHAKKEASRPWAMVRNPAQKNLYYRATLQRLGDSVVVQWDGKAWPSSVLPEDSPDIWKGSVRAKDWRYVTSSDGGWLPRGRAAKQQQHKPSVVTKRPAALQQAAQPRTPPLGSPIASDMDTASEDVSMSEVQAALFLSECGNGSRKKRPAPSHPAGFVLGEQSSPRPRPKQQRRAHWDAASLSPVDRKFRRIKAQRGDLPIKARMKMAFA